MEEALLTKLEIGLAGPNVQEHDVMSLTGHRQQQVSRPASPFWWISGLAAWPCCGPTPGTPSGLVSFPSIDGPPGLGLGQPVIAAVPREGPGF